MAEKTETGPGGVVPANDVKNPDDANSAQQMQVEKAVLSIARLIGRRMAREDFEAMRAANDNRPGDAGTAEDRTDRE